MKNTILLVIVAIIIVLGIFLINKNNNKSDYQPTSSSQIPTMPISTNTSSSASNQYIVNYTDNGFSPASITVPKGATVMFNNNSSNPFWVASNPHPTHTDYPEFDAKKDISVGSSYDFTFTKTGTWGYHNHLNPSEGGTVIVQ